MVSQCAGNHMSSQLSTIITIRSVWGLDGLAFSLARTDPTEVVALLAGAPGGSSDENVEGCRVAASEQWETEEEQVSERARVAQCK